MRKVIKWSMIGFIVLFALFCVLGVVLQNSVFLYIAVGILFGGSFLLAVGMTVYTFMMARKRADQLDREAEEKRRAETNEKPVNDTEAVQKEIPKEGVDRSADSLARIIHMRRKSPRSVRVGGVLLAAVLISLLLASLMLFFFRQDTAAICCLAGFAGIILGAILIIVIKQRPIYPASLPADARLVNATVLSCKFADSNVRAIYTVKLLSDGKKYTAYSDNCYWEGDRVTARIKGKKAQIIEDENS